MRSTLFVAVAALLVPVLAVAYCTGDCDTNGIVTSGEYVDCRGIAFGSRPLSVCPQCDCDLNGVVSDAEWMQAERNALNSCSASQCPAATVTPGLTPTSTATRTNPPPATRTPTLLVTPTATSSLTSTVAPNACVGDCDANHDVAVNELVTGVNIALERAEVTACSAFDENRSTSVSVNELVQGVNNLLRGCP